MSIQIKKISSLVLIAGITLSLTSCIITRSSSPTQQKKSTTTTTIQKKHKKPHPHGGPPGQTKKGKGHPGKKH